ncbi:MAG TPA: pilus assembly protein PilM [Syntrophomonadaceae bacterium]|nr:pilus assembly protein PilM [Syntrophomonadaceae bacterium]
MEDIFALDIGTRKIVGLIMEKQEDNYVVLDSEMLEHKTRAMIDGQIHDVEAVANSIQSIKAALESRLKITIKEGAVAAAGRSLKTSLASANYTRSVLDEVSKEEVLALEVEAVQKAQYKLAEKGQRDKSNYEFFCVGYSVASYTLDGQEIGSLVGQIGKEISVEVIATFLPRVVVDSLFSSLKRADLDIYSLTLEPIAALSVAIPPNMRLLNLALVDIGAGTADIAIVKNGKIYAYAMVPMGGDKITEFIANEYLLDFDCAETLKRQLGQHEIVKFVDILGNENMLESVQIREKIQYTIEDLVKQIAQNICELNQDKPDAVILVGGGSLTPGLSTILADKLNLSANRVGFRDISSMGNLRADFEFLNGAQGMTPLGIAYNCFVSNKVPFIKVKVNSQEVVLWNPGQITVAQALLSTGISLSNIYGKPGLGKTIEINGVVKSFKGQMGIMPIIKVNKQDSSLDDIIQDGDIIEFVKGVDGQDAVVKLADLLAASSAGYVYVNDEKVKLEPIVFINGKKGNYDEEIPDRAKIEFYTENSIHNILLLHGVPQDYLREKSLTYYLNGELKDFKCSPIEVMIDGKVQEIDDEIAPNSKIYYTYQNLKPKIKDVLHKQGTSQITIDFNGESVTLQGTMVKVKSAGQLVSIEEELTDGMRLEIDNTKNSAIFSDVFRLVDIEPTTGRLNMKVNGEKAGFTTPIFEGSKVELSWE